MIGIQVVSPQPKCCWHQTYTDYLKWVQEVWDNLATDGIVSKAQELGMSADLGPEILSYSQSLLPAFCVKTVFSKRRCRTLSTFSCVWTYMMKLSRALVSILNVFYGGSFIRPPYWKRLIFSQKNILDRKNNFLVCVPCVVLCED